EYEEFEIELEDDLDNENELEDDLANENDQENTNENADKNTDENTSQNMTESSDLINSKRNLNHIKSYKVPKDKSTLTLRSTIGTLLENKIMHTWYHSTLQITAS
ncbi:8223_t:CDS:2, partial [Diversispora eburnea]